MLKLKPTNRLRKTKDPCPNCSLNRALCLCSLIPSLHLKTKICLIIHSKELKRTTNTGALALRALTNSEMRVRGATTEAVDLSDLLVPEYRTYLFYPSEDALELDQKLVNSDPRPIQLLVPDGNWRQAGKVHVRHPELKDVPRVKISTPNLSQHHLRIEHMEEGMATLEAIAEALTIIEGDFVGGQLRNLYQEKLRRTLKGRGVKI